MYKHYSLVHTYTSIYRHLRINQFYPLLDDVGSWKGESDQLCDSVHALAAQADCISGGLNATIANQGRPECQQGKDVHLSECVLNALLL